MDLDHAGDWDALDPVVDWLDAAPLLDPDDPELRYTVSGGRWEAMGGTSNLLVGRVGPRFRLGLSFDGFVELINFDDSMPVPWQSFRASFGWRLLAGLDGLDARTPGRDRSWAELGYVHESDHVADWDAWIWAYGGEAVTSRYFVNETFSSYEYLRARLGHRRALAGDHLDLQVVSAVRVFTPSVAHGLRGQKWGASLDVGLRAPLGRVASPYLAGFVEAVAQDLHPEDFGARPALARPWAFTRQAELGLELLSDSGWTAQLYGGLGHSDGRGVDVLDDHGLELRLGFRFVPTGPRPGGSSVALRGRPVDPGDSPPP